MMAAKGAAEALVRAQTTVPLVLMVVAISSSVATAPARANNACEAEIIKASRAHDIPVAILYAVGLTETGKRGSLQPYALNIEGKAEFAPSKEKAIALFQQARAEGKTLIDLGCMQINHHYHSSAFPSLAAMLDPHLNVDYAARFLAALKRKHSSWSMTVARYHAGPNNDPAQKRYVCRVIGNMIATGMGAWTPEARSFCQP
nr:transglycosylase SLT domain-containing protein [Tianweitania sediminis]